MEAIGREDQQFYWYKSAKDLSEPWSKHRICPERAGQPHDLFVADIDGDGKNELIVVRMYISTPGVYIYKPGEDITKDWEEYLVQEETSGDGTVAGDFDGDGIVEIAPGFRDMCKAAMLDITGISFHIGSQALRSQKW